VAGTSRPARSHQSSVQGYLAALHLPLIVILFSLIVGGFLLGFGLRPGTDKPPVVPDFPIQLNIYQIGSSPSAISIDETLMQQTPSIVQLQIDLFGSFSARGKVRWNLTTESLQSQPHVCQPDDPYNYLGTVRPNPFTDKSTGLILGSQTFTRSAIAKFVGRRMPGTASNTFGLSGQSLSAIPANTMGPLGEINLCWSRHAPIEFDGQYAAAAIPPVNILPVSNRRFSLTVTQSLYLANPLESAQPITSGYSLQAGPLPTGTDSFGWRWSSNQSNPIQLTAVSISRAQHESYLGFVSGVMFGIAAAALVAFLQETVGPVRRRRIERIARADEEAPITTTGKLVWLAVTALSLLIIVGPAVFLAVRPTSTAVPTFTSSNDVHPQSSVLVIDNCYDIGRIEPVSVLIACADGNVEMEGLSWSSWGSRMAFGTGIVDVNNCEPDCADGTFIAYPIRVKLSEPIRAESGELYFTHIRLFYLNRKPANPDLQVFNVCSTLASLPYIPVCSANQQSTGF
jgi:hypothetical protein